MKPILSTMMLFSILLAFAAVSVRDIPVQAHCDIKNCFAHFPASSDRYAVMLPDAAFPVKGRCADWNFPHFARKH